MYKPCFLLSIAIAPLISPTSHACNRSLPGSYVWGLVIEKSGDDEGSKE